MCQFFLIIDFVRVGILLVFGREGGDVFILHAFKQQFLQLSILKALSFLLGHLFGDESDISEQSLADECDFELHAVGGQRTSFIGEDVFDLSQLFVEGG